MQKIDKLLATVKRDAQEHAKRREIKELQRLLCILTIDQLREIADSMTATERITEIFASVGGLHLLESG